MTDPIDDQGEPIAERQATARSLARGEHLTPEENLANLAKLREQLGLTPKDKR